MFTNKKSFTYLTFAALFLAAGLITACSDDSPVSVEDELRSQSYSYAFNEGQAIGDDETAYRGEHDRNLGAEIIIEERGDGNADVTVRLSNTVSGENYPVHAHDMADPETTPNGTPYNETPNGDVFAGGVMASGMSGTADNISPMSFNELTRDYEGFFVVHDPLQDISTTDLTTYLILGLTAR